MRLLQQLENRPLKIRCKEDQEKIIRSLSGAELELLVDIRPFMQRDPFVVQSDASLSRAYRLFRTMGLRHLFVSPPQPKVNLTQPHARIQAKPSQSNPFSSMQWRTLHTLNNARSSRLGISPFTVLMQTMDLEFRLDNLYRTCKSAGNWRDHQEGHSRG